MNKWLLYTYFWLSKMQVIRNSIQEKYWKRHKMQDSDKIRKIVLGNFILLSHLFAKKTLTTILY